MRTAVALLAMPVMAIGWLAGMTFHLLHAGWMAADDTILAINDWLQKDKKNDAASP